MNEYDSKRILDLVKIIGYEETNEIINNRVKYLLFVFIFTEITIKSLLGPNLKYLDSCWKCVIIITITSNNRCS